VVDCAGEPRSDSPAGWASPAGAAPSSGAGVGVACGVGAVSCAGAAACASDWPGRIIPAGNSIVPTSRNVFVFMYLVFTNFPRNAKLLRNNDIAQDIFDCVVDVHSPVKPIECTAVNCTQGLISGSPLLLLPNTA
jgi:hypothetical protein